MRQIEASTYEKIQPSTQLVTAATPFFCRRARRDTKMTRRSGRSSEGRKRTKAAKETVLACMERWTSLVKVNETKVNEKQKGTSVANIFTNTTLVKKVQARRRCRTWKGKNGFKERKENESREAVQESGGNRRKWRNGIRLRKYGDKQWTKSKPPSLQGISQNAATGRVWQ